MRYIYLYILTKDYSNFCKIKLKTKMSSKSRSLNQSSAWHKLFKKLIKIVFGDLYLNKRKLFYNKLSHLFFFNSKI